MPKPKNCELFSFSTVLRSNYSVLRQMLTGGRKGLVPEDGTWLGPG